MRTLIALALAVVPTIATAQAASSPVLTDGLRITAALVDKQPSIVVTDPNAPTTKSRQVTPFQLAPDLSTRLVWLQVQNEGNTPVEVPYRRLRLQAETGADGLEAMPLAELKKPWGRYLSWATSPPHGNPLWFEREIAVRAEGYLDKELFGGGTIPPGGRKAGYVAFPADGELPSIAGLQLEFQKGDQTRTLTVPLDRGR